MQIIYSWHWSKKRKFRPEITDDIIEYCIMHSDKLNDKYWDDDWNALFKIPGCGRLLKVVYKIQGKDIKILTAYWLD